MDIGVMERLLPLEMGFSFFAERGLPFFGILGECGEATGQSLQAECRVLPKAGVNRLLGKLHRQGPILGDGIGQFLSTLGQRLRGQYFIDEPPGFRFLG